MTSKPSSLDAIELTIEIAAPPDVVFKYFSDPQRYRLWMGEASSIDPKRGGVLTVVFGSSPTAKGEILEWVPNEKVVFSWGHGGDEMSRVNVTFERKEYGTLVVLQHTGLRSDVERQGTAGGWRHYLSQLSSVTWAAKLKGRLEGLIDTYLKTWNEDDAALRAKWLADCWAENGTLCDKFMRLQGRDTLNAHVSTVRPMMPGVRLERAGAIQMCHGFARFPWKAVMPQGQVFASGVSFCEFDGDGRIRNLVGFWDEYPTGR